MFAYKPWTEFASRILLSTAILCSAFVPAGASASLSGAREDIINFQDTHNDLASNFTIGSGNPSFYEQVPILSEQIAMEAIQDQEERVKLKVWATPDIYLPGTPIRLQWSVHNMKAEDLEKAEIVIRMPAGLTPADPDTTYTPDGLIVVALNSRKELLDWNVGENAELPVSFELHLLVNDDPITFQTVTIDQPRFSVERGRGGNIKGLNGKVELEIPASAISESLSMDIREPAPQAQPAVSLTWQPLEIIAVGTESKKNVDKFKTPIKIKIKYDEAQIFDWDENALSIYYYDPDLSDWFPLETTVDTNNNTLTAYSDHLTVFDYKANNWQSQSLPTIDAFKVSDFTGAGTYAINIWTPPGPGGLQPSLALTYNSQVIDESSAYSQPSWVGMGWDLDTGAITRNMHGTDSTSDDTFSISAGGVSGLLLPINESGNIWTYATADQSFMKIQFDSNANKWTAWGTDGTKYEFASIARTNTTNGCSSATQLNIVWRWSLTSVSNPRVIDNSGNPISLTYSYDVQKKSASCYNEIAVYPLSISYPNGKYSVSFVTEARTDYQTSWTTVDSRTLYGTKRLKEILVQHLGATVRRYALSYAPDTATSNVIYPQFKWSNVNAKTLTLRGVQEFGSDGAALPSVLFTYGDGLHVTDVNNGQGGLVHINYERWTYFDDWNDDLRSLLTIFGDGGGTHPECIYSGNTLIKGTEWAKVSGGPFGCENGNPKAHLKVGYQVQGSAAQATLARRSIPENVAKPAGRYRLNIVGGSFAGAVDVNWGFREWATGRESIPFVYSDNVASPFSLDQSFEMPVDFNVSDTYLYLECTDCKLSKYQFALFPQIYRVVSRTVTVQPNGVVSNYTYRYDNASPNTSDNSAAALTYGNNALYTKGLREYRGNAMSQVVNPEGMATINWFYQTDTLKGRAYDTLVMKQDQATYQNFDSYNPASITGWTPLPTVAIPTPKTSGTYFGGPGFDWGLESYNTAANWNISFARTSASLTSGEVAVAHVALGEDIVGENNAQGEVGLVNGGQFFGITFQSNTAIASNGATLLTSGNFKKDEWYGVMLFLDAANGSRIRIWQLDDPNNFGETVISGVGSGSWSFRQRVNDGALSLDSYFEGIPYSESITRYNTTVQYDTIANNGITDLAASSLLPFKDLQVAWNTVTSVEQRNYNGDARFVGTKQEFTYAAPASYGNLLTQKEYAGDNGSWTLYRGSKYEYYPNATNYIVSLPARQVTLDCTTGPCDFTGLGGKKAETYFFYDGATAYTTPPTKGDLTRQRTWVQNNDYSQTSFTYYTNGNLKDQIAYTGYATASQTGNPSGPQTTTTTYDTAGYNTYPVSVTNDLGQVIQTGYDYALGLPNKVVDPNGNPNDPLTYTSAAYDGFGRMTDVAAPGDSLTAPTLHIQYVNYNSTTNKPFQINLTQRLDGTAWIKLSRFYDGAGRQIQTQTVNAVVDGALRNVVVDYQYNATGRLWKQSIPRAATSGTPVYVTPQDFSQSTVTLYDVMGRTLSVTQPNTNGVSYVYNDLSTIVTDPKLYQTITSMDVWGRTTFVDAPEGPDVSYTYDILNQLKTATRGGQITTINYDAAGRKLNMTDPDMGFWQYQYDALGNLKFQTDQRGCLLSLGYDNLNRLTTKNSSGAGCIQQISTSYGYDDITNGNKGKGRRTSMNDASGSTSWKYDLRGRVLNEVKTISGVPNPFTTQWTYNSADLPVKMIYPGTDAEEVMYDYNSDGSLNSVISNTGGTYLASTQYDEAGRIKQMDYGAGILRKTFSYFPWNTSIQGGLLNTAISTRLSDSVTLQSFAYTYDRNANISMIIDNQAGPQTQTFGYDSLNRLKSAAVTGGSNGLYNETYEYNSTTGNLSMKGGVNYTYNDPSHVHAVTSLSNGNSYQYDANGNMTQRIVNAQTFDLAYDAENRLVSVTGSGGTPPTSTPTSIPTFTPTATQTHTPGPTPTNTNTPPATSTPSQTPTQTPASSAQRVAYWKLEESASPWSDSTGRGHTLSLAAGSVTSITGKVGNGLNNASNSTDLQAASHPDFDFTRAEGFTIETWARTSNTDDTNWQMLFGRRGSPGGTVVRAGHWGASMIFTVRTSTGQNKGLWYTTPQPVNDGQWHHWVFFLDAINIGYWMDGQLVFSEPHGLTTGDFSASVPFYLLQETSEPNRWLGDVDEFAVYRGVLSQAEIVDHYNNGAGKYYVGSASTITLAQAPSSNFHPVSFKLLDAKHLGRLESSLQQSEANRVAYWKLEEGASPWSDASGHGHSLSQAAGSVTSVTGKVGNGLNNTSNTTDLQTASHADFDFTRAEGFSIEAWARTSNNDDNWKILFGRRTTTAGTVIRGGHWQGSMVFGVRTSALQGKEIWYSPAQPINDGQWHHWVFFLDQTNIGIWMDGQLVLSQPHNLTSGDFSANTPFYLLRETNEVNRWLGDVDEFAVYRGVLSEAEILDHYNNGIGKHYDDSSGTPAPTATDTPTHTPTLTPATLSGPLGHWKFDESSWAGDCLTADILDWSGSNRHGTACINGDAPFPVPGNFGNAGRFDGVNEYANMGPGFNFTSSFTASVWIALDDYNSCGPAGNSQHIIGTHHLATPSGHGRGWGMYWDCDGLAWELTNSTGSAIASYGYIQPSPFPANGSWHHVALVYDSTVPSATLYWDGVAIYSESGTANVPSLLFNNGEPLTVNGLPYAPGAGAPGKIDDTRVYDRVLSPEEIASIALATPPTNTPTNTPASTASPTSTPTPTATQTPGPTATPTLAATAPSGFSNATFVYDGDGKRVKSTFNGSLITYFVGAHYEVTGSTVTKYYYAGTQRIAMRTNGTLNYLLGDHLGSTSLVTDESGNNPIVTQYKAWGEVRSASGTSPTKYTFTGQYSYASDFGLHFYNARWYDSYITQFSQPDSIVPDWYNPLALDRYAYAFNNPVRYNDPSGHCPICIGLVLAGAFFIFNGTSDSYQPNLSAAELESRQASVEIGTSLIVSAYAIQYPLVEAAANTYDCATGFCDPSLMLPGSASGYADAAGGIGEGGLGPATLDDAMVPVDNPMVTRTYSTNSQSYTYTYDPSKPAALGYMEDLEGLSADQYNILRVPDEIYSKTIVQNDFLHDIINSGIKPNTFSDPNKFPWRVFAQEMKYLKHYEDIFGSWHD